MVIGPDQYDVSQKVTSKSFIAFEWSVGTDPVHIEVVTPQCKDVLRRGVPIPQPHVATDACQFRARAVTATTDKAVEIRSMSASSEAALARRRTHSINLTNILLN